MKHGVTVGANRDEIVNWVNLVAFTNSSQIDFMMNMNKAFAYRTIFAFKVKVTDLADSTILRYTSRSSFRVALIGIDGNLLYGSFDEL
ncbi:hypothetical protein A1OU_21220 [Enterovibrio norvegicus]|nr:hypothetical protein A1OU_21220 [Enterovibrio norvegicus]